MRPRRTLTLAAGLALAGAAALAVAVALGGCASPFGRALIPELKPIEAGIVPTITCAQLAKDMLVVGELSAKQLIQLVDSCERMQAGQRVVIDPQAARNSIAGAVVP